MTVRPTLQHVTWQSVIAGVSRNFHVIFDTAVDGLTSLFLCTDGLVCAWEINWVQHLLRFFCFKYTANDWVYIASGYSV